MQLIRVSKKDHRIEGMTEIQVIRVYEALKSTNNRSYCLDLEVMVKCLKMDIGKINRELNKIR